MFNKKKVMVNYEKGDRVIRERFNPETNEYVREEVVLPGQKTEAFVDGLARDFMCGVKIALPIVATTTVLKVIKYCVMNREPTAAPEVQTVRTDDGVEVTTF